MLKMLPSLPMRLFKPSVMMRDEAFVHAVERAGPGAPDPLMPALAAWERRRGP